MTISDSNPIQFWPIADETFNEKVVCSIYPQCFFLPYECGDETPIQVRHDAGQTLTLGVFDNDNFSGAAIDTLTFSQTASGIYRTDIDFDDYCGIDIRAKIIVNGTPTHKSDGISVRTTHECTSLINYSNSKVYNSIDYVVGTPPPEFKLRIPAIFFEEAFPDEHEEFDLSGSQTVRLVNKEKRQKKLDIGRMPFYMHQKMKLVLSHDTIEIDNQSWIRSEAYEIGESNKRWPLRKASVILNDKNYIVRNVL